MSPFLSTPYKRTLESKSMSKARRNIGTYTAVFEPSEEGGYVVYIPSLPGCMTQGRTFEEARANAADAIAGYLDVLRDLHEEIHVESTETIVLRVSTKVPR
jgi:predicted RNase H-like HicB family nuclease